MGAAEAVGSKGPREGGRWVAFDGLRGVSIAFVLALHSHFAWAAGGWMGVDVFFALSGFLITWLLLAEWDRFGSISLRGFWVRRAYRLLPVLIAVLAVAALVLPWVPQPTRAQTIIGIPLSLGFVSNLYTVATNEVYGLLTPLWSLGVEAQFYLLWPLALAGMLRLRLSRRQLLVATLALVLASAALAPILWHPATPDTAYENPMVRCQAILLGCAAALVYAGPLGSRLAARRRLLTAPVLVAVGVIVALASVDYQAPRLWLGGGLSLVDLAAATIVLGLAVSVPLLTPLLEAWPLVALGRISYSVYVVHYLIFLGLWHHDLSLAVVGAHWGLTLAAGVVLHVAVERPFLRTKTRRSPVPDLVTTPAPTDTPVPAAA